MTITIKTRSIEGTAYTFTASSVSKLNSEWQSKKDSYGLKVFDEFYVVYSGNLVLICPGYTQGPDKRLPGSAGFVEDGSNRSFKMHIESSEFPYSIINDDYLVVLSKAAYTPKIKSTDGFYFAKVEGKYDYSLGTYVSKQLYFPDHEGKIRTYLFYKLSDIYDNNLITIAKVCNALSSYNRRFSFSVIDTNTFCFFWSIQNDSTYIPLLYTSTNKYKNVFTPEYFANSFSYFKKYLNDLHFDVVIQKVYLNEKADDVQLEFKVWYADETHSSRNVIIKPITSGSEFNTIDLSSVDYLPDYRIDYCPADDKWPRTAEETTATIECGTGYYGLKHRYCDKGGVWSKQEDKSSCSYDRLNTCPETKHSMYRNVIWPETTAGEAAIVYCPTGNVGRYHRLCYADGTWSDIESGGCKIAGGKYCLRDGVWPATNARYESTVDCPSGYSGQMHRNCQSDGTWGTVDSSACQLITHCPATTDWPKTQLGLSGQSECPIGYTGTQTRICRDDGTWGL